MVAKLSIKKRVKSITLLKKCLYIIAINICKKIKNDKGNKNGT